MMLLNNYRFSKLRYRLIGTKQAGFIIRRIGSWTPMKENVHISMTQPGRRKSPRRKAKFECCVQAPAGPPKSWEQSVKI